jgi:hypothetical protein
MHVQSAQRQRVAICLAVILVMAVLNIRVNDNLRTWYVTRRRTSNVVAQERIGSDSRRKKKAEAGSLAECSCYRTRANSTCCQRAVLREHKFGWILTQKLFRPFGAVIQRLPIQPSSIPQDRDYRHVAFTRNYLEALVSGYLYHKSGRECWLTFNGWKRPKSMGERNIDWIPLVNKSGFDIGQYPPRNGRSICRYLAQESEEAGMKVFIATALSWWYSGVDSYLQIVEEKQARQEEPRTLFVCLEEASDPQGEEQVFFTAMDWLFPGGHKRRVPRGAISNDPKHDGHATDHSRERRLRLLDLVKRHDREYFNGTLARTNSYFGCNGTIH